MSPKGHDDERFADWVDGNMSPRDLERFEAELRVNKSLRQRAEAYQATVAAVREALRTEPGPAEPDSGPVDLADQIMARVAAGGGGAPPVAETAVAAFCGCALPCSVRWRRSPWSACSSGRRT